MTIRIRRRHIRCVVILAAVLQLGIAHAELGTGICGPMVIPGQYGPWDYRTDKERLPIVESAHFTRPVELLIRGNSTAKPSADLEYTLQRIPNHHRALISVLRLSERKPTGADAMPKPFECYFERAVRWRRDDVVSRMIYAQWLVRQQRKDDARAQLEAVVELAKDNPLTHQNAGLIYFEMQDYDRAVVQARRTAELNPGMVTLVDALKNAGKWTDAAPAAAVASAASSAASAASEPTK